ncbi:hypothetical protein DNHGIG_26850 [Collibacillus ludicampi]|jgi:hypothetical protein|uniref:Uncharacterized protein n=1 Tax=Collibacillus ludicampi TaxID=2771369 RepID=A0AAV4LH10_9BACL|nr:hypothetical protein [Collibacillus ludicampi]GIM47136.1 hypothetical protein DNHGIG_26850 [Collibacillus ludicampi]
MKNTPFMQVLTGPLNLAVHAVIHTTIFQALNNAGTMKSNAQKIIQSIPTFSISPMEYNEVKNSQGMLELEAGYGTGTFYVVDAQKNQEVYVFHQEDVAQYASNLLGGNRKQQQNNQQQNNQGDQNEQGNTANQNQKRNDANDQVLVKLQQILEALTKNNN